MNRLPLWGALDNPATIAARSALPSRPLPNSPTAQHFPQVFSHFFETFLCSHRPDAFFTEHLCVLVSGNLAPLSIHGGVHAPQVFWQAFKTSASSQLCSFFPHFFPMLTHLVHKGSGLGYVRVTGLGLGLYNTVG